MKTVLQKKSFAVLAALTLFAFSASAATFTISSNTTYTSSTFSGIADGDVINISATLSLPGSGNPNGCDRVVDLSSVEITINVTSTGTITFPNNSWLVINNATGLNIASGGTLDGGGTTATTKGIVVVDPSNNDGYVYTTPNGSASGTPNLSCIAGSINSVSTSSSISFSSVVSAGGIVAAVPVTWMHVSAKAISNNLVQVAWSTASEENNSHFEIEYSLNGSDWIFADVVASKAIGGNSNEIISYEYNHTLGEAANFVYYRIKQQDFNGDYDYSSAMPVKLENKTPILIKNIGELKVNVSFEKNEFESATINVIDMSGRNISTMETYNNNIDVTVDKSGIYVIEVLIGREAMVYKKQLIQ